MHIYVASSLYKAAPPNWLRLIKELQESKKFALAWYAPLRNAIVQEIKKPGTGQKGLEQSLSLMKSGPTHKSVKANSRKAFRTFLSEFSNSIGRLNDNYLSRSYTPSPVDFEGYLLEGRFHFSTITGEGIRRYVYISNSEWSEDQTVAFVELLTIIGKNRHKCGRDQVWFLDLRNGLRVEPKRNYKKLRKDLRKVLELVNEFSRFFSGGFEESN